ncbi:Acetoin utilization deacetylase AcuC [Arboricoccus pini]|uniref:Acetoin utilization deacetylase AcuC n=1 Tax=Arboricoccus pini TaxID=1963835 RepID=A0A212RVC0_9PROT|nr:histone deacetylase family protein [Arboricoccus pini]SNB76558.1 Acetoin utilization deacetylase AcuC [Arboricoccus pini]
MNVYWNEMELAHDPAFFLQRGNLRQHFEVPGRALALLEGAKAMGLTITSPPPVDPSELETVHAPDFLAFLEHASTDWRAMPDSAPEAVPNIHPTPEMLANGAKPSATIVGRLGWYTADLACPIGPSTWQAALAAATGAIAAADDAAAGRHAYALARPPGHHAYRARTGGHCYLNNAALAAERLRAHGADRVAILDIDSHHGNGTQGIFWERDDVFFASIHGDPNGYYPWYVGHADETGAGAGQGCTLNQPLAQGTGDGPWLAALDNALESAQRFGADAVVVSLGFDASEHEPLSFLKITADGFARAGQAISRARRPTAIVQEGGYAVDHLGTLLQRFLDGFGA